MGAHVHSIYRISRSDTRNLYVFVYGIPPWTESYSWLEEKFVTISKALGVEGLLVMSDESKPSRIFHSELVEAYAKLDDRVRALPCMSFTGLIVASVNPHSAAAGQASEDDELFLIPVPENDAADALSGIVRDIVEAAKSSDLSRLRELDFVAQTPDRELLLRTLLDSVLLQPNVAGIGYDFGKLLRELAARRKRRRRRFG